MNNAKVPTVTVPDDIRVTSTLRVVVDPGHGGMDSGTTGKKSSLSNKVVEEKEWNLEVGVALNNLFIKNKHNSKATRTSDNPSWQKGWKRFDEGADLRARIDIASEFKPDVFISIHFNSSKLNTADGVECYYNYSNKHGEKFLTLSEDICKAISSEFKMKNRGAKNGSNLHLTRNMQNCILIECGFIDNSKDFKKFDSKTSRDKLASLIYKCVVGSKIIGTGSSIPPYGSGNTSSGGGSGGTDLNETPIGNDIIGSNTKPSSINGITLDYESMLSGIKNQMNSVSLQEFWGQESKRYNEKFEPHIFGGFEVLQETGFDIRIDYGPHQRTMEKLNNVYLRSVGKQFDASGNPIYEQFEFLARGATPLEGARKDGK